MNKFRSITLLYIIFFFICFHISARAENLQEILKASQTGQNYQIPENKELNIAQELFAKLFKKEFKQDLKAQWANLNYNMYEIVEKGKKYIVLSENKDHRTGRGFYLFPYEKQGNKALQIPHSFKDLHTGAIGLNLALEGSFSGIAWNTVPRNYIKNEIQYSADLSDLFDTYFAAFAKAFALCHETGFLFQLHGFSKDKRKTEAGAESDIILSGGDKFPDFWIKEMDTCLEKKLSSIVSIYPLEVRELGALQTSIGIILNQMGHKGFIHVEMSKSMRVKMRDKAENREKFLNCILINY